MISQARKVYSGKWVILESRTDGYYYGEKVATVQGILVNNKYDELIIHL